MSGKVPSAAPIRPRWLGVAPFVFLMLWSGGFVFGRLAVQDGAPLTLLAVRYALVVVLMAPAFLVIRPPLPGSLAAVGHIVVVGLLIQAFYFGLMFYSFELGVPTGTIAIILALQPVLVGLIAPRLVGEAVGLVRWAGLVLGLVGAGLVIMARSEVAPASLAGIAASVAALCCFTAGTLYEKRFGAGHHPIVTSLVQFAAALLLLAPASWLIDGWRIRATPQLALSLGYLVLANSIVSMTLLLAMIRHGEASRVSALLYLVPPVAGLMAWAVFDERLTLMAWIGMAVAIAGVALATRPQRA